MPISLDDRLQPAKPPSYTLPPVVQPQWRLTDILHAPGRDPIALLEETLCRAYGVKYCRLLDRARSGIFLLCEHAGIKGEWISGSCMHRPTAVIIQNHSKGMVFAKSDQHMTLQPDSVEELVSDQTNALLVTHTYGKTADLKALRDLADSHGLYLIENAVHMSPHVSIEGRSIGSWGDACVLSFNVDKPLGGILGGAILTSNDELWDKLSRAELQAPNREEMRERILTTFLAYRLKPWILKLPFTGRHRRALDGIIEIETQIAIDAYSVYSPRDINPLQARVASARLSQQDHIQTLRQANANLLCSTLKDCDLYDLPVDTLQRPHCFTYFCISDRSGQRLKLATHLAKYGIESKWRLAPLHLQGDFDSCRRTNNMAVTEEIWRKHLLLPVSPLSTTKQLNYLAEVLLGWNP